MRLASHAEKVWFQQVRGITLEWYADELSARNAERRAIHVEHPKYNIQSRSAPARRKVAPKSRRRKAAPRHVQPRRTWADIEAAALEVLANAPGISASELGRRLGLTDARGRQIARKLTATAPRGQDETEES